MSTFNPETLLSALKWRYATKRFDSNKSVPEQTWKALEESLILTPSSYGLQPWKFIVITNKALRAELTAHSWNQTQVVDCSHYVVFTVKSTMDPEYIGRFIDETARIRGIDRAKLNGYEQMMMGDLVNGPRGKMILDWAARQAYIALGNLMTSAALLGVDACPMEGIIPSKYDEILKLNGTGYQSIVACAVGYRSNEDPAANAKKIRYSQSELIDRR